MSRIRLILYFRGVKESHLVETSERFLSVDGSGKSVVKMGFDENIKKRNLLILFKFNGE